MIVNYPFAFHCQSQIVKQKDGFEVLLYTSKKDEVKVAWLAYSHDNEEYLVPLESQDDSMQLSWRGWKGTVPYSQDSDLTLYYFQLNMPDNRYCVSGYGTTVAVPSRTHWFRLNKRFSPPEWPKQQVFYQIFPERFCNGNEAITPSPDTYPYHVTDEAVTNRSWGEAVPEGTNVYYGGDLIGIRKKLDYLIDLGVTAIYLNPIFSSPSNHKYDGVDYFSVDPAFGGDKALISLIKDLKKNNIKILLDAVLNHTSDQHPWFDRYGQNGACHNAQSEWRDFYTFDESGKEVCWNGCPTLVKLNHASMGVQNQIYAGQDSVLRYWLKAPFNIDGWRLDAIHMLGEGASAQNNHTYLKSFRRAIKDTKSDAYVLGEHTREATDWLQGNEEDGAINYYGFTNPVVEFFSGREDLDEKYRVQFGADYFSAILRQRRGMIPFQNQLNMVNQIEAHDAPRLLSMLEGDVKKAMSAATLQFTYIGIPCIYYGSEVGLEGGYDPDCRRCFPWEPKNWVHSLLTHYKALVQLRKEHEALQSGDFIELFTSEDVFVFARWLPTAHIIVGVTRGSTEVVSVDVDRLGSSASSYVCLLGGDEYCADENKLTLRVPEGRGVILAGNLSKR
ncbi:maltodextrin glucosidase [Corallincola holothuriorum]|uniref:Maltodextrin glucosidase n=1 Tax=Corallincola holothuriorum TaxID=2282215 RepID=A0A368NQW6_9GAMM|nr:maltodextrin glucosidase [Corallincola holothuriorum]RCU52490.1 maltodextrin glucosidase [Corallincola holothuriorum]